MFPFVYVLVFLTNDCLQAQLCRLIRLCFSQFRKCTARLLAWTAFPRWILSCIANSQEIVPVVARILLSKEIQLLLITFFQHVEFKGSVWLIWEGTIPVPRAQGGVPLSLCYCDQMLLSFRLLYLDFVFVHYLACSFCGTWNCFSELLWFGLHVLSFAPFCISLHSVCFRVLFISTWYVYSGLKLSAS